MHRSLFCGQVACKHPVPNPGSGERPWPIRCGSCGAFLYPEDVLKRLGEHELEPEHALLMTDRGSGRVAIQSSELGPSTAVKPPRRDVVDSIFDKADLPGRAASVAASKAGPPRARRSKLLVVTVAGLVLLAAVAIIILLRR